MIRAPWANGRKCHSCLPIDLCCSHGRSKQLFATNFCAKIQESLNFSERGHIYICLSSIRRHARLSDPEMVWLPMEHTPSVHGVPTNAMFDDGNGGEFRQCPHFNFDHAIPTQPYSTQLYFLALTNEHHYKNKYNSTW